MSNLPRRSVIDGTGRVTPNPWTKDGGTQSKAAVGRRRRHFLSVGG